MKHAISTGVLLVVALSFPIVHAIAVTEDVLSDSVAAQLKLGVSDVVLLGYKGVMP
jgi:hypothetical protein